MLYMRLFHGRINPEQDMDDWGSDGPVFGPYEFIRTTYASLLRLENENGSCDELFLFEGMLFYDSIYYGDWSVFDEMSFNNRSYKIIVTVHSNSG